MIELKESLFRCSEFRAADLRQFEQYLTTRLGVTEFDLPDRRNVGLRDASVQLHDLIVGFWSFGTSVRIEFSPHDAATLGLNVRGQGSVTCGLQTAAAVGPTLSSPDRPLKLHYGADLEKVFVRFGSDALKRKLAMLLGVPINRALEFDISTFFNLEMRDGLLGLIRMLVYQVDGRRSLISPLALRELEEAVIIQLWFASRHKWSERLHRRPLETSPNIVARIEQFIEAHWSNPITIETLSDITGVSGRTLHRTFVKARGYSPMVFVRKLRLEHARRRLCQPDADTSVTAVALACGFSNLGRFASDYRAIFKELPSETLAMAAARA